MAAAQQSTRGLLSSNAVVSQRQLLVLVIWMQRCCMLCWCVQLPAKGKATFKERSAAVGREAALQKQLQEAARDRQVQQLLLAAALVSSRPAARAQHQAVVT
jgi:hypothetical protein